METMALFLRWLRRTPFLPAAIILLSGLPNAIAGGKIGIYGIRMVPRGADAERYSKASWGGGLHAVVPVSQLSNVFAGVMGLEIVDMLSKTTYFIDNITRLRVEQQTSQDYFRFYLGSQVGGHGNAFIRPHAGVSLALVHYGIRTDVVVPDDYDREKEIRQNLHATSHTVFGYDITLGVDLNFYNKVALDGGVRYVKSFSLPQQLGEGSETIHPQYFQIYFGVGVSFRTLRKMAPGEDEQK